MGAYDIIYADKSDYNSFTLQNLVKGMQMENMARAFFVKIRDFAILLRGAMQVKLRKSRLQP